MHVGFALLTLFPGRVGGSESNVRGLLGEFAQGHGPERVTVLANRHVAGAYEASGPVGLHLVRSYRPGEGTLTRALAMAAALAAPRVAARDVPAGLDVVHYPVTVPIPRIQAPTVVTLLDVQHHDLPGFFSRGEAAFRRRAYDRAARDADVVITISEFSKARIVEAAGDPGRSGSRRSTSGSTTCVSPPTVRRRSSTCPSASCSTPRTSGRTRTTSA